MTKFELEGVGGNTIMLMLFNNVIFQQKKLEKYPSPVTADSAMVQHFQKISTVRVDHWLE